MPLDSVSAAAADELLATPLGDGADPPRRRRLRARMALLVGGSCVLDTLLLSLFALAGLGSMLVPLAYAGVSAACWGSLYLLLKSGWTERFRDPYITVVQIACAAATELGFSLMWPELAFYFLSHLFIVFAFGALRLSWRKTLLTWLVVSAATGLLLLQIGAAFQLPADDAMQLVLTWMALMLTILRCTFVGLYGNGVRAKLIERNQQLAAASAQIEHLASFDPLTGALNRRPLWTRLEEQARRTTAALQGFGVAMLDLDHFKSVNDRYGHVVGDQVLKTFAEVVRQCLRPGDTLGRYGGEEFLLLLNNAPGDSAETQCRRICEAVAAARWDELAPGLELTVSIGVAGYDATETAEEIVQRADLALYAAKHQGRNRVVRAAPARGASPLRR